MLSGVIIFQLFFLLVSLGIILHVWQKKKIGILSPRGSWLWVVCWILADIAVLFPQSTTVIANHFGIGRGSDFVLYSSIGLMFFILFRLHVKLEVINREITKVVRRDALEPANCEITRK